jgi:hypothetical protein
MFVHGSHRYRRPLRAGTAERDGLHAAAGSTRSCFVGDLRPLFEPARWSAMDGFD